MMKRPIGNHVRRQRWIQVCAFLCASIIGQMVALPWAVASDHSLLDRCWTKDQLKVGKDEQRVRRSVRRYDTPPSIDGLGSIADITPSLRGVIRRVNLPEGSKLLALTIDFCEQVGEVSGYDGAIIDYLREVNVPATLFVGGKWLRSHDERAQQLLADERFELASHGEAHRNFGTLSAARRQTELLGPQAAYQAVRQSLLKRDCRHGEAEAGSSLPSALRLFRFPYGICAPGSIRAVNDAGFIAVQWDISTGDAWRGQSAQRIARTVLQRVKPGSIILAHGNGRGWHTAEGLRKLIPALLLKGYRFVTVSELLRAGEPVLESRCYDTRPGDTKAWVRGHKQKHRRKGRKRRSMPIAQPNRTP